MSILVGQTPGYVVLISLHMNRIANLKALEVNQDRITRDFMRKTDTLIHQLIGEKQTKARKFQLEKLDKAHQVMMDIRQNILRLQEELHRHMPSEE